MSRALRKVLAGVISASALAVALPTVGLADWSFDCDSSHRICIFKHSADLGWFAPKATTDVTVDDYSAKGKYPNTNEAVNDSLTAAKNLFPATDVRFYEHADQAGVILFCLPQSTNIANVGSGDNDLASSHQKGQYC